MTLIIPNTCVAELVLPASVFAPPLPPPLPVFVIVIVPAPLVMEIPEPAVSVFALINGATADPISI
jgi:hypothetical protein